ncbi:MAG: VOC family protein [Salinivirgaceae bacterium]|nr:VOC family protein [Salinivirgaceae bacterium]
MKINHIALNIENKDEITNFYQNILCFKFEYDFDMPFSLSSDIFGIENSTKVYLVKKENTILELFMHSVKSNIGYAHICLDVDNRENTAVKCNEEGYPVIRIERNDKTDLLFIKDKNGNIFELKDKS